ncbi:MAG TPA: hypothetical protein VIN12_09055 [Candidatus Dormibacteraeota bacterium]|jgi:uncharacterized membrane protein HdeD (DUF308 family)
MDSIFLSLVFRNPDGSLTGYSWFLAVVALYMISSGIWCLVSPASYVRFMTRTRWVTPPSGPFWSRMSSPGWVRASGVLAIAAAVGFMTWVLFFTVAGRLY